MIDCKSDPALAPRLRRKVLDCAERQPGAHALPGRTVRSLDEAEELAGAVRRLWGLNSAAALARTLEHRGIQVLVTDLPRRTGAVTFTVDKRLPFIVANRLLGAEQRRFALARGLAALCIDRRSPVDLAAAKSRFAGALLMPRVALFLAARDGFDKGSVIRLAHKFGVSATALVCRLAALGLKSEWTLAAAAAWDGSVVRRAELPVGEPAPPRRGRRRFRRGVLA